MGLADRFGDLKVFWAVDHSQLEIRFLAQASKDKKLIELIKSGKDIHSSVGHRLTGKPIEEIMKDRDTRTAIKGIHFGIIYGLAKKSLFYKLKADAAKAKAKFNLTPERVAELYDAYFEEFTGVRAWLDEQVEFAEEHGYVQTLFGFRREIVMEGDDSRSTFWKNQAFNTPIQGGAHTLLLCALAVLAIKRKTFNLLQDLAMEGHDALVGYTSLKDLAATYKQAIYLMETEVLEYIKVEWPEVDWQVPLKAEAKAGFRYGVWVKEYTGQPADWFLEKWCTENRAYEKRLKEEIAKSKMNLV